jgi:lipopolysaccharide export LptBFGC system permease protein LptF
MTRPVWFVALIAAIAFWSALLVSARAEESDSAALAAAMKDATATLQGGIRASESEGTTISAKFEIEDGKLRLSVYTMKGDSFMEVVADPKTGAIDQGGEDHGC